jgi:hypothetical protein
MTFIADHGMSFFTLSTPQITVSFLFLGSFAAQES